MDFLTNAVVNLTKKNDSDKSIYELIRTQGLSYQKFYYETDDGYINKVVRIIKKEDE